jgi:cobyrinic acid a,c-diamide synthase
MAGLLPVATHYTTGGARTLGYRSLTAPEDFWAGTALKGHEFHASSAECLAPPSLFHAADSRQASLGLHGHQIGNILGSYIHIIDRDPTAQLP